MTSRLRLPLLLIITSLIWISSAKASDPYTQGYLKWDAGDYIGALEDFLDILNGPDADRWFDKIATLTGERYNVDELSEDGRNPSFSPDNRHFSWEEEKNGLTVTHIARLHENRTELLHTAEGYDLIFSPDERHALLMRTEPTEKMADLQQQLSEAFAERDRDAITETRNALGYEEALHTRFYLIDLNTGETSRAETGSLMLRTPAFDDNGTLWLAASDPDDPVRSDIYSFSDGELQRLTDEPGFYDAPMPVAGREVILFQSYASSPFPTADVQERHRYDATRAVVLFHPEEGEQYRWKGEGPVLSQNGATLAFMQSDNGEDRIYTVSLDHPGEEADERVASADPVQHPALSPDGSTLAYMLREGISWDIHLVHLDDGSHDRLSYDIQHELFPHFLNDNTVLAKMGEARHRRSHIYDVESKDFHRLFHNNTIRTVSMENDWTPSPDGNHLLIVSERDGNTISPEQGVYLVRIGERISNADLVERLEKNLQSEKDLRDHAETIYEPIFDDVRDATKEVNITRLYHYQKSLYDFGSKHMTQPGNQKASEYIYETLKSFGYEPELQWFNPQGDIETANVIARLEGTEHPEVVYILSSHFDSVMRSPGADDNSTGTAVLMEAARVLADNPQPATIIFASLTAEESGLLGAREFVRVAEEEGLEVAGVINNDMMGWTRHHRLDNTIRFSNYGIRDVQHSGAILFTDLITYDSRYYRFTDAQVFYEAYGDVIGGIGSYPILGNPNYHQPTDRLETINHQLVREVAKSTTATLMNLANTPSKVTGLEVREGRGNRVRVNWNRSPESDISHYLVRYTDSTGSEYTEEISDTSTTLRRADISKPITVVAVNKRGMESWDEAVFRGEP
jgi:hypothetical protein